MYWEGGGGGYYVRREGGFIGMTLASTIYVITYSRFDPHGTC